MQIIESLLFVCIIFSLLPLLFSRLSFAKICNIFSIASLAFALGFLFFLPQSSFVFGNFTRLEGIQHFSGSFAFYSVIMVIVAGLYTLIALYNKPELHESAKFVTIATVSSAFVFLSQDIFNFYVFLELFTISTILPLAIFGHKFQKQNILKYLLLGGIASGLIVFGIEIYYIVFGSLNTSVIKEAYDIFANKKSMSVVKIATAFIIVASFIKMGMFPFMGWVKKVYTSLPNHMLVFYATVVSMVAIYIPIFFLHHVINNEHIVEYVNYAMTPFILATIIIASFLATKEKDIRVIMAYSTLAQMGYAYTCVTVPNFYAVSGGLFHIWNNFCAKLGIFAIIASICKDDNHLISQFAALKKHKITSFLVCVCLASLIGLPATGGFVSKFYMFKGLFEEKMFISVIVFTMGSVLNIIYSWRIISAIYFSENSKSTQPIPILSIIVLICATFVITVSGFAPSLFYENIQNIAITFLQH